MQLVAGTHRSGPPQFVETGANEAAGDLSSLLTNSRIVRAVVCQPLAARPPNMVLRAATFIDMKRLRIELRRQNV
jgi:hypothetical protein